MTENKDPKMLVGKENNPARLLPQGNLSIGTRALLLFLIGAVVFGAVLGISIVLLNQRVAGALIIAEVTAAITLVIGVAWVTIKRKK